MFDEPTLDTILASQSLSKSDLNYKFHDENINELALKISNWKTLAPFIGLTHQDEEDIEEENRKNMDRKIAMLRRWSTKYGRSATYLKLAEGFESLKRRDMILFLLELMSRGGRSTSGAVASGGRGATGEEQVPRGKKKQPVPKLSKYCFRSLTLPDPTTVLPIAWYM